MKFKDITLDKNNAILFAIANYDNPQVLGIQEFREDYRLFRKLNTAIRKEKLQLALNLVITINNIFTNYSSIKLINFFVEDENIMIANTILSFLDMSVDDNIDTITLQQLKIL